MAFSASDREHTVAGVYNQTMADVIGIWWQYHKRRLAEGNIAFAYGVSADGKNLAPYNPKQVYTDEGDVIESNIPLVVYFSDCVWRSFDTSWRQFLQGAGRRDITFHWRGAPKPEGSCLLLFENATDGKGEGGYIRSLVRRAARLRRRLFPKDREGNTIVDLVSDGQGTAAAQEAQMTALFAEELRPVMMLSLAKIDKNAIPAAEASLGMENAFDYPRTYDLLDNEGELDYAKLELLGMGSGWGCPAARSVSKEARVFLQERGVEKPQTVVWELTTIFPEQFNLHVGEWYKGLPENERIVKVVSDDRELLDGLVRPRIIRERQQALGVCPVSHEGAQRPRLP